MRNEASLIALLKKHFPTHIGDDAAVIPFSHQESYVISQDNLVEDIHFRLHTQDMESLAHKALHVNLSDITAMGATPRYVLMGLSIPRPTGQSIEFLEAFSSACKNAKITLIGGDTTRSPDKWFISITIIGTAPDQQIKYRNTACKDDVVCVVGNLGHAHIGFTALERSLPGFEHFKQAFCKPTALTNIGQWLGQQPSVHAMMDLSDGLYLDLTRLCEASRVGANIALEKLLMSDEWIQSCEALSLDPTKTALTGGEDYGLLFTVEGEALPKFLKAYTEQFSNPLHTLGHITPGTQVQFTQYDSPIHLDLKPFEHFS